jgi:hypothetical protein
MAGIGVASVPTAVHMVTNGAQVPGRPGPPLGHPRWHQPGAATPLLILTAHPLPTGLLSLLITLSRTLPGALLVDTVHTAVWVVHTAQARAVGMEVMEDHSARAAGDLGDLQAHGLAVHGRAGGVEAHARQVTGLVGLPVAGAAMHRGRPGLHALPVQPPQASTPQRAEVLFRRAPATATRLLRRATRIQAPLRPPPRLLMLRPRMSLLVPPVLLLS